jgi:hypothetical protein
MMWHFKFLCPSSWEVSAFARTRILPAAFWASSVQAFDNEDFLSEDWSLSSFGRELRLAHTDLLNSGVTPSTFFPDESKFVDFVGFYDMAARISEAPVTHLQRLLVAQLESTVLSALLSSATPRDRARLTSCSAQHAGSWLLAIPLTSDLALSDFEFATASRFRLGLPPQPDLPSSCLRQCRANLLRDPDHAHSCRFLIGSLTISRHDRLRNLLAYFLRLSGTAVFVEPRMNGNSRPDLRTHAANALRCVCHPPNDAFAHSQLSHTALCCPSS